MQDLTTFSCLLASILQGSDVKCNQSLRSDTKQNKPIKEVLTMLEKLKNLAVEIYEDNLEFIEKYGLDAHGYYYHN